MSQYHVYLPPKLLPFPLDRSDQGGLTRVTLKTLPPPPSHASFSQHSLPIRHASILQAVELRNEGSGLKRINQGVEGDALNTQDTEDGGLGTEGGGASAVTSASQSTKTTTRMKRKSSVIDTSRRRSTRLAKSTVSGPLGTLPPLDESGSFLSFNTTATTSDPSQFPAPTFDNPASSLHNLPSWRIPLSRLSSLSAVLEGSMRKGKSKAPGVGVGAGVGSLTGLSVIVCIVGVDRARIVQTAEEKRRGQAGSLWVGKWDVVGLREGSRGTEAGEVGCGVQLWDSCARDWGDERVRRGDVVLLENVEFRSATIRDKNQIVVSSKGGNNPKMTVLYRTLPRYLISMESKYGQAVESKKRMEAGDRALRPDLRLGRSDLAVRKVAEIVDWFADWVGGEGPA